MPVRNIIVLYIILNPDYGFNHVSADSIIGTYAGLHWFKQKKINILVKH